MQSGRDDGASKIGGRNVQRPFTAAERIGQSGQTDMRRADYVTLMAQVSPWHCMSGLCFDMAGKAGREGVIANAPGQSVSLLILAIVEQRATFRGCDGMGAKRQFGGETYHVVSFLPWSVAALDRPVTSLLDRFEKSPRCNAVRVSAAKFPKLM